MPSDLQLIDCTGAEWEGRTIWEDLFAATSGASAYVNPIVVGEWIKIFGRELRTQQLVLRSDGGQAVGTCLLSESSRNVGPLRHNRAYLNTDGEPGPDSFVVEFNRPLVAAGSESGFYQALADYIRSRRHIDELQATGICSDVAASMRRHFADWQMAVVNRESPYVDMRLLREQAQSHITSLHGNTRSQIRRSMRLYEAQGAVTLELASARHETELFFSELVDLHTRRWRSVGKKGGFASPRRMAFHSALIEAGRESGVAQLLRLRVGDRTLAVLYNLVANRQVCFYQSGIVQEENAQLKPGMLLHHLAIEHYMQKGMNRYDFLPSLPGEGRYKQSLSNMSDTITTMTCMRPGVRGSYFRALRSVRSALIK